MKILCSDFDNTLCFENDETKTKKNIKAIEKFISDGNIFCIITGRTYKEIKPDLIKLSVPYTYLVCADDARILDSEDNCLEELNIGKETAEKVFQILKENGYEPYFESGDNYTTTISDCIKVYAPYITTKEDGIKMIKKISQEVNVYAYGSGRHININNIKNNKKDALLRLAKVAKLNPSEFHVIGDDINDYEMLGYFNSATVEKHHPILDEYNLPVYKSLSDYIEYIMSN